jgi:hypothetical protein
MASSWWYALDDGSQRGPFQKDEIERLIEQDVIKSDTFLWSEGMENWVQLSALQAPRPPPLPSSVGPSGAPAPVQRAPATHEEADEEAVATNFAPRVEAQRAQALSGLDRGQRTPLKLFLLFAFWVLCRVIMISVIPGSPAEIFGRDPAGLVGSAVGSATVIFLVGGLIPVIVWAFRRFAREAANAAMNGWAVCSALVASMIYYGELFPPSTWSVYATKDCGYSVSFPSAPTLSTLRVPLGNRSFNYERAQLIAGKEWLRAECTPYNIAGNDVEPAVKEYAAGEGTLTGYAAGEGLQRPLIRQVQPNVSELRGYKTIDGVQMVIVLRMYRGSTSALILTVGSREADYPTRNGDLFFKSVKGQ